MYPCPSSMYALHVRAFCRTTSLATRSRISASPLNGPRMAGSPQTRILNPNGGNSVAAAKLPVKRDATRRLVIIRAGPLRPLAVTSTFHCCDVGLVILLDTPNETELSHRWRKRASLRILVLRSFEGTHRNGQRLGAEIR